MFVREGRVLLAVLPDISGADEQHQALRNAFLLGRERMPTQDVDFFTSQLVELAVRALSPGINDPGTARMCLDRLEQALCQLAGRQWPSSCHLDDEGMLRAVSQTVTFGDILDGALDEIRRHGQSDLSVMSRMLDVIREIASCLHREDDRAALVRHAALIGDVPTQVFVGTDGALFDVRHRATVASSRSGPSGPQARLE
jgi:uncharacterized membrane protein